MSMDDKLDVIITTNPIRFKRTNIISNYRIKEFNDFFRIEKQFKEPVYFLGIPYDFFITRYDYYWQMISNKGSRHAPFNTRCIEPISFSFKTKEECLEAIKNFEKYPIIHELTEKQ